MLYLMLSPLDRNGRRDETLFENSRENRWVFAEVVLKRSCGRGEMDLFGHALLAVCFRADAVLGTTPFGREQPHDPKKLFGLADRSVQHDVVDFEGVDVVTAHAGRSRCSPRGRNIRPAARFNQTS